MARAELRGLGPLVLDADRVGEDVAVGERYGLLRDVLAPHAHPDALGHGVRLLGVSLGHGAFPYYTAALTSSRTRLRSARHVPVEEGVRGLPLRAGVGPPHERVVPVDLPRRHVQLALRPLRVDRGLEALRAAEQRILGADGGEERRERPLGPAGLDDAQRARHGVVARRARHVEPEVGARGVEHQRLRPAAHARVLQVLGGVARIQEPVRREDRAKTDVRVEDLAREGLRPPVRGGHGEGRDKVATGALSGDRDPRRIATEALAVPVDPEESTARVLERRGIRVALALAVVDVEEEVPRAGDGERHDPVGLLREHPKTAAVHVHHDGQRVARARGHIGVELVERAVGRAVRDVPLQAEIEARGLGVRHRVADASEGVDRAVHRLDVQMRGRRADALAERGSHAWKITRDPAARRAASHVPARDQWGGIESPRGTRQRPTSGMWSERP